MISTKMRNLRTSTLPDLEKVGSSIRIKLNPWPFLWTVVGAWMWFGVLRLVRVI